jgi:anti-anti-sigma factor
MMKPRVVVTQDHSGVWLIELFGEHDLATVAELGAALEEVFSHGTRILVDMSETTFIDSSIVGALIEAQRHTEGCPDEHLVVVAPPDGRPAALFDLVEMRRLVPVAESRSSALRDLAGRA